MTEYTKNLIIYAPVPCLNCFGVNKIYLSPVLESRYLPRFLDRGFKPSNRSFSVRVGLKEQDNKFKDLNAGLECEDTNNNNNNYNDFYNYIKSCTHLDFTADTSLNDLFDYEVHLYKLLDNFMDFSEQYIICVTRDGCLLRYFHCNKTTMYYGTFDSDLIKNLYTLGFRDEEFDSTLVVELRRFKRSINGNINLTETKRGGIGVSETYFFYLSIERVAKICGFPKSYLFYTNL